MGSKAELFKADAIRAGWKASITSKGSVSTVTAKRPSDGAVIEIRWNGEACLNESRITIGSHTRKLRNAAACRRELSGDTIMPHPAVKKTGKIAGRRNSGVNPPEIPLPDDDKPRIPPAEWGEKHVSVPAEQIVKAVRGRTITWINVAKRTLESATVLNGADQRQLRVEISPVNRKRLITFAARGEGFRSVYIDRIVNVA